MPWSPTPPDSPATLTDLGGNPVTELHAGHSYRYMLHASPMSGLSWVFRVVSHAVYEDGTDHASSLLKEPTHHDPQIGAFSHVFHVPAAWISIRKVRVGYTLDPDKVHPAEASTMPGYGGDAFDVT